MDSRKIAEDANTKELNQFVQNMLKQMQERFDEMSSNIIGRVDEMGNSANMQASASTTSRSPSAKSWMTWARRKTPLPTRSDHHLPYLPTHPPPSC